MRDPVRSYRESAVRGASPLGLIVILYDEIVRSMRKASHAFDTGDVEARTKAFNHSVEVIGYLQSILDFEKGGEIARNLSNFYNLMRAKLLQTQAAPTHDEIAMLAREFAKVGAAWRQAELSLAQPATDAAKSSEPGVHVGGVPRRTPLENGLVGAGR
jgi:flagellar secretion chaperone FliS